MQTSPGFINLQLYREISEDPEKITYMQIENWEDEESLENDLASAHVQDFWKKTGHTFEFVLKKYSVDPNARVKNYPDMCKEEQPTCNAYNKVWYYRSYVFKFN